jgi:glycyl-tRNA synthetase beta chain
MDRELLLEIGCEELPAGWLPGLTTELRQRVDARLAEFRLKASPAETYSTPRRLTAVANVAERQDDLEELVTGPPVSAAFAADGRPTPAALGFAKKQGVEFTDLTRTRTAKGEYLAFNKRQRGHAAVDVLGDVLAAVLRDLRFPKEMHWDAELADGRGELVFGRPIRWLLFLYGGRVVPFTIGRTALARGPLVQEIESAAVTYGHRFLATSGRPGRSIKVRHLDEYRARLAEHFVILEHAERRDKIRRDLEIHARRLGGRVMPVGHTGLLEEVSDLVEYPSIVAGAFDPSFLELPQEVLTTTMIHHQHWFPVVDEKGALKPAFLAVTNTDPRDGGRAIATNAERVLTARLRDAKFFWDADRRTRLEDRLDRLDTVIFHQNVGSYREKAERIARLARWIAENVFERPDQAAHAETAARLAKADLTAEMVREFTELQGIMGGLYAKHGGHPEPVWKAIYYHYLPVGVEADAPPSRADLGQAAVTWAAVSLADKVDGVHALYAAGERPSGSRDPFGMRRQAQGVLRVLADLHELIGLSRTIALGEVLNKAREPFVRLHGEGAELQAGAFWLERLRYLLEQRGLTVLQARAATPVGDVEALSPARALKIGFALRDMRTSADFQALAVLFKRVKNIARELKEETGGGRPEAGRLDREALTEAAERALLAELDRRRPAVEQATAAGDYRRAFAEIAALRPAVDRFFIEVFVMVDDAKLRTARLALMAELRDLVLGLADISELVPQES